MVGGERSCRQSSRSKDSIQMSSAMALAKLLYSDSVLDRATVHCFLEDQEMRFDLKKMAYPLIERRSSGLLAQLASE